MTIDRWRDYLALYLTRTEVAELLDVLPPQAKDARNRLENALGNWQAEDAVPCQAAYPVREYDARLDPRILRFVGGDDRMTFRDPTPHVEPMLHRW